MILQYSLPGLSNNPRIFRCAASRLNWLADTLEGVDKKTVQLEPAQSTCRHSTNPQASSMHMFCFVSAEPLPAACREFIGLLICKACHVVPMLPDGLQSLRQ